MRIFLFVFIAIISFSVEGFSDDTNPDTKHVWARSGLNVRSGPGTNFEVIEKLMFGDSVTMISESDVKYNIIGISKIDTAQHYFSRHEKKGPFILYGKWVEIYTTGGKFGYVVDHYLLDIPANATNLEFPFEEISRDTLSIAGEDGSYETSVSIKYKENIIGGFTGNKCYEEFYILSGYSIQDAFVMLLHNPDVNLHVTKNWPNELQLWDGGMYSYRFILKDGVIYYSFEACC